MAWLLLSDRCTTRAKPGHGVGKMAWGMGWPTLHVVLGHMQPACHGLYMLGAGDGERGRNEWDYLSFPCPGICASLRVFRCVHSGMNICSGQLGRFTVLTMSLPTLLHYSCEKHG